MGNDDQVADSSENLARRGINLLMGFGDPGDEIVLI